jgi:hypothetical protein
MRHILNLALLTIILASCRTDKSLKVRFDGIYQTRGNIIGADEDTARMYIQFYADGQVIGVTTAGKPFEITSWFNVDSKNETVSKGTFTAKNNQLDFSTTSKFGTLIYKGKIVDEIHLDLEVKSLINGHIANEKFSFIKNPDPE